MLVSPDLRHAILSQKSCAETGITQHRGERTEKDGGEKYGAKNRVKS